MNKSTLFKKISWLLPLLIFCSALAMAQHSSMLVIDERYPNKVSLLASTPISTLVLEVADDADFWKNIHEGLRNEPNISEIHLLLNTTANTLEIGPGSIGVSALNNGTDAALLAALVDSGRQMDLFLYSCSLANNDDGRAFLNALGQETKCNVLSSAQCASIFDGDFQFTFSTKNQIKQTGLILD
ncbi:DUF4347 domain-containing protein [Maribacter sp. 2307ULW6-5]|uniref:DUF4347 domain-containing protein n=1 Tax=Maribacter sp. 2307ULW6-5 TaxID=3386275 RepID=UPI0039BC95F3